MKIVTCKTVMCNYYYDGNIIMTVTKMALLSQINTFHLVPTVKMTVKKQNNYVVERSLCSNKIIT